MQPPFTSSWEDSSSWYGSIVGKEGHFYHQKLIFPFLIEQLEKRTIRHLLDIGCGSAPFLSCLPPTVSYSGVEISKSLVKQAQKNFSKRKNIEFLIQDATTNYTLEVPADAALSILALQNIKEPSLALKQAAKNLKKGASFFAVLNHPCFRIPRQSFWEVDEKKGCQFRRIDQYATSLEVPIQTHPGVKEKSTIKTVSYHFSLEKWISFFSENGFLVKNLKELYCPKLSTGKFKGRENRARKEFPLFLVIEAVLA